MTRALPLGFAIACVGLSWFAFGTRELQLPTAFGALRLSLPAALGLLGALPWIVGLRLGGALAIGLRVACWTSLVLALCRPALQRERADVSLVALIDVSDSIGERALAEARSQLAALKKATGDHVVRAITFARRPQRLDGELSRHSAASGATDLEAAMRLAYRLFEPEQVPNLVVLSDGNETHGDAAAEAARAAQRGVRIDHLLLANPTEPPNASVRSVALPRELALGVPFRLRATVAAEQPTAARLQLYVEDTPPRLEQTRELTLPAGLTEVELETKVETPGRREYRVLLQPSAADRVPEDDSASVAVEIPGPPRVLIVDSEPALSDLLARALRERDFRVDVRPPSAAPREARELGELAFVILSDVPPQLLRNDVVSALRRYVEEGGGLLVSGGQSAGLAGPPGSPLEQLLPVRAVSEERRDQASLALALIIDCSGSMAGGKLELAREAATLTAQTLADPDLIEVIGFSSQPERRVRLQAAENRASIAQSIARLAASGGTQLYPALDAAYRDLRGARARLKHAILLTDGQTQEAGIEDLASSMRADGITLSTVGLGTEVNRALLETLAGLGGGRAYFPQDARNVPQIFMSEASRHKRPSAVDRTTHAYGREHAGFLEGVPLAAAPPLGGYVTTQLKPLPAQVLLETERGEPLLARWRVGLGVVLAWTSDLKPRWANQWLRWPSFGRWAAQLVREHARAPDSHAVPLETRVEGGRAHVSADVFGSTDEFQNELEGEVHLRSKSGEVASAQLVQTAPARYQAELQLPGPGAFTVDASFRRSGRQVAAGRGQLAQPYAAEYVFQSPNAALLAEVSARTGGRRLTRAAEALDAGERRALVQFVLWPYLAALALAFFLLEQSVRRAQVFGKNPAPGREGGSRSVW